MNWVSLVALAALAAPAAVGQPQAAMEKNDQGLAAATRHDHTEAQRLYREAIDMWRALGPGYDAHRGIVTANLGESLCSQGRRPECAAALEESVTLLRRTLGISHLRTLTTLNMLGGVRLLTGDVAGAGALFDEALPLERRLYPNDLQLGRTLLGIAGVRMQNGDHEGAVRPAEEGLTLVLRSEGENSADTALAYATVAEIHRSAHRPERALPLFRKARSIYENILGPDHPRVGSVLSQEGLILMIEGKMALAEQAMLRALDIINRSCPNCAAEQFVTETNLAVLRIRQKKYAAADQLLSHALALQEPIATVSNGDLAAVLKTLAMVRQNQNLDEDAARLRQRAGAITAYR
jgi:tetratricopeptide (TPR) repeat protein